MNTKNRKITTNLLLNSLTARLSKKLQSTEISETDVIKKLKRECLENAERETEDRLQRRSDEPEHQTFQILKYRRKLQEQSELERKKQERLESSYGSRSGLSSVSLLPLIRDNEANSVQSEKEDFAEYAFVDKDDQSHVKVFKLKGIYQPTNKYSSRIEPLDISPRGKPSSTNNNIQESLKLADADSPVDLPVKSRMSKMSKKGLRVSWSRQSQYHPDGTSDTDTVTSPSRTDTRASQVDVDYPDEHVNRKSPSLTRKFNSRLSMRSDTFLIQKQQNSHSRSNIEIIGLRWKRPPGKGNPEASDNRAKTKPNQRPSHNLMPVTLAMDKEGMSTRKTRWQVRKPPSLSKVEIYHAWQEKLEILKNNEYLDRTRKIPTRASVITMPV